jgi:hypothetical protein
MTQVVRRDSLGPLTVTALYISGVQAMGSTRLRAHSCVLEYHRILLFSRHTLVGVVVTANTHHFR